MPLNRCQIRNEYSLADPDLYKNADKDDPEALLEGVAMAGLVGVLRQLGDLAEFAAEIFHNLHEEVMATAGRGHDLIVRVQQLEAEFPSVERTLLSQSSHTAFLYRSGIDWHPNIRMDENMVAGGDLPRFVMDSYEECRGPPRLFLLDKFDVAGAGACLKRYTDPSFFKVEATSSSGRKSEGQREKKNRKVKKRGPRRRNGDTPEIFPSSHAKLHQLFLEESIQTNGNDPEFRVKLKKRQFSGSLIEQDKGKSYMEKFLDTYPPEQKIVHEICIDPLNGCESGLEIIEIGPVSPLKESITDKSTCSSPGTMEMVVKPSMDVVSEGKSNEIIASEAVGVNGFNHETVAGKISSTTPKVVSGEEYADGESKSEVATDDSQNSDDITSEIDNYMDALATIDSEVDTDSECKRNPHCLNLKPVLVYSDTSEGKRVHQSYDAQSVGNSITSEDGINFFKERESSSCSVSVDILAETTPYLNGAVVSVPSIPGSNTDFDKMDVDDHSMSEEICGNEPEEHAARSIVAIEADDGSKSVEHFGEASNSSCLTYHNTMIFPADMGASLRKDCLPSPESDEINSTTKPDFMSGINNGGATWSCSGTDSRDWSHGEHFMHDTACGNSSVHSESSSGKSNTPDGLVVLLSSESEKRASSVEEHSSDLGRVDVGVCSDIGPHLANPPISDSRYSETVGPTDLAFKPIGLASSADFYIPSTEGTSANQSSASDFEAGALPSSPEDPSIKGVFADVQSEKETSSAPIVGQTEILPPMSSSSEIADIKETDIAGVLSPGYEPCSELPSVSADGDMDSNSATQEQWQKRPSEKTDTALSEHHLSEAGKQYPVSISGDECNAVNVSAFAKDAVCQDVTPIYSYQLYPVVTVKDLDDSETQVIHANATSDHGHIDNHDDQNESLHHNVYPFGIQVGAENHHHENVISMSSSSSVYLDNVQEQNEEESSLRPTAELASQKHVNSVQDAPENSGTNMCNVSSVGSPTLALLDGSLAENVQNNEPRIDRYPPPLPPLPPMQWRLSRFQNCSAPPEREKVQNTIGAIQRVSDTVSDASSENKKYGFREGNPSFSTSSTSISSQNGTQISEDGYVAQQGVLTDLEISSQNNMNGIRREENLFAPISSNTQNDNQISEESYKPSVNPCEPGSLVDGHSSKHSPARDEWLEHLVQITEKEVKKLQPRPGLVAHESGTTWSSTSDGIQTNADGNANGTLHKKSQRPRNPLIDEVVAIDKSKLRKVERVKSQVESKPGESLLEQMQLRKVERVKHPVERTGDGESVLEHLQLRKFGEKVKQQMELKTKERESLQEQLQLRKVGERVKPEVEQKKPGEPESSRVQSGKVGERVKPDVEQKPEETESPRVQLRKVGEREHPVVGSVTEDRDILLEQIRNKSFNLKPAVAGRPNMQGRTIQGPRTNLKVAAMLEKASNIRQATAGSDEEDDADNWSDC